MATKHIDTIDALAVAIHAYDINTKVVKHHDGSGLVPNSVYVRDYFGLNDERVAPEFVVTEDLREQARDIKTWLNHNVTMSLLTRGQVNDFQKLVAEIVANDTMNEKNTGIVVWAPKLYRAQQDRDTIKETVMQISYRSRWLGKEKERVEVDFKLLEKRFHGSYNAWTAFGHDGKNNLVRFMTKHERLCADGKISGKVKNHDTERYHDNAKITMLNFVKAV